MTVQDFIDEFRRVMGDEAAPYLFEDADIVRYLNEAVDEACERALLIEDRATPAATSIALVAGQGTYPLHSSVIKIKRVALGRCVLDATSTEELDDETFGWETMEGSPRRFIHTSADSLLLVRIPRAEDVAANPRLALTVYRRPLAPLTADDTDAVPEIQTLYQPRLLPWVYRCAFLKRDSEVYDASRAAQEEAVFAASFGSRPDANVQRKRRDRRPPVVKMRGW